MANCIIWMSIVTGEENHPQSACMHHSLNTIGQTCGCSWTTVCVTMGVPTNFISFYRRALPQKRGWIWYRRPDPTSVEIVELDRWENTRWSSCHLSLFCDAVNAQQCHPCLNCCVFCWKYIICHSMSMPMNFVSSHRWVSLISRFTQSLLGPEKATSLFIQTLSKEKVLPSCV